MKVSRKIKWILALLAAISALAAFTAIVDYQRAKSDKRPRFSFQTAYYLDGGTSKYVGLGYSIKFNQRRSHRRDADGSQYSEVLYGPDYRHWILPLQHQNVRTVVTQTAGPDINQAQQNEEADAGNADE